MTRSATVTEAGAEKEKEEKEKEGEKGKGEPSALRFRLVAVLKCSADLNEEAVAELRKFVSACNEGLLKRGHLRAAVLRLCLLKFSMGT